jgi:hypothetical protein
VLEVIDAVKRVAQVDFPVDRADPRPGPDRLRSPHHRDARPRLGTQAYDAADLSGNPTEDGRKAASGVERPLAKTSRDLVQFEPLQVEP